MTIRRACASALVAFAGAVVGCGGFPTVHSNLGGFPTVSPRARGVTAPVPVNKVNDAAIWVHPTDPEKSLILVSNELRGVELHDVDGSLEKLFAGDDANLRASNVDVLYGFGAAASNGGAKTGPWDAPEFGVDLAIVLAQAPEAGIRVLRIDAEKRRLRDVTAENQPKVAGGAPVGSCAYRSARTGRGYVFVTAKSGKTEQYELTAGADARIGLGAAPVRVLELPSKVKFCCADDEVGAFYVSEENVGVWRFDAEPGGSTTGRLIARVGEHGLAADVVGLGVYGAGGGRGYLLAVSQGEKGGRSAIKVYRRDGANEFVASIEPAAEPYGPLERISGVAVTNRPLGARFPNGLMVANDRINANASEDFKLFAWEDVAGPAGLVVDTKWSARGK